MTEKIGRNDECPCGSGKKYKKCCSVTTTAKILDLSWQTLRQTEGRIVDHHLMPYVMDTLPASILKTAIDDLFPEELPNSIDGEHFFHQFMTPWVLFNWLPEEDDDFGLTNFDVKQSIAINYLKHHQSKLNSKEKRFIEEMDKTHYSFYSILEVEFEKSIIVKDILLGTTHSIKERQGTHYLKRGDIVFSRILTLDNQSIFIGMAPIIIPAKFQITLIDFREWLIEENDDNPLTPEGLRLELDLELLDYFFECIEHLHNPQPTLVNTDGDLILFSKSYFKLDANIEETLGCLLPLTLLKKPDPFLESAKRDKQGKITNIEFPWLIKGNKKHSEWENTIMGQVTIKKNKLILETNSEKRTQKGKKLLSKYLGDKIQFQQTLMETPEQKAKSLPNINPSEATSIKPYDLPEIQEQLKLMAKKHWEAWFDSPIPALENKTPRQAAKTKAGRERLEALLLDYERNDAQLNEQTQYFKADVNYIKSELKLG
ncbi:MAG: SEC-C domain-containing protein [Legionella sp.]|nr:SEC-C domain-containing protein [Legionella sp.]